MKTKTTIYNQLVLRKITTLLALVGLLIGIGYSIVFEGLALASANRITSFEQLKSFSSNSNKYAFLTPNSINYTEIDFLVENKNGEVRYKGYLAQKDNEYFLVFRHSFIDQNSPMIIQNAWFDEANMLLFRESVINIIVDTTDNEKVDVDARIYPIVFVDVTGRIVSDLPVVMIWTILLVISIIALTWQLLISKRARFLSSTKQYQQWLNDTSEPIYQDSRITLTHKTIAFHRVRFKVLSFNQVREVQLQPDQIDLFFDYHKCSIKASKQIIDQIRAAFDTHLLYEAN